MKTVNTHVVLNHVPSTALSTLQIVVHLILQQYFELSNSTSIIQMKMRPERLIL